VSFWEGEGAKAKTLSGQRRTELYRSCTHDVNKDARKDGV
jgi:hypothetical protein